MIMSFVQVGAAVYRWITWLGNSIFSLLGSLAEGFIWISYGITSGGGWLYRGYIDGRSGDLQIIDIQRYRYMFR